MEMAKTAKHLAAYLKPDLFKQSYRSDSKGGIRGKKAVIYIRCSEEFAEYLHAAAHKADISMGQFIEEKIWPR